MDTSLWTTTAWNFWSDLPQHSLMLFLAKSIVVFGLALLLLKAFRRRPTLRHNLLISSFGIACFVPILTANSVRIPIPLLPTDNSSRSDTETLGKQSADSILATNHELEQLNEVTAWQESDRTTQATLSLANIAPSNEPGLANSAGSVVPDQGASDKRIAWSLALWIGWGIGAAACLVVFALETIPVARIRRRSRDVVDERMREACAEAGSSSVHTNRVQFLESSEVAVPFACGILRPAIVLPERWRNWDPLQLRFVLEHELAHLRRLDLPKQAIARVVCCVYWMNPLAWVALTRLRIERELCVDLDVTERTDHAPEYASLLITLANQSSLSPASLAIPMASSNSLRERIEAIVCPERKSITPSRLLAVSCAAVMGILLFCGGLLQLTTQDAIAFAPQIETEQKSIILRGRVTDPSTNDPLGSANVYVIIFDSRSRDLEGNSTVIGEATSNEQGDFAVQVPPLEWHDLVQYQLVAIMPDRSMDWTLVTQDNLENEINLALPLTEPTSFQWSLDGSPLHRAIEPYISFVGRANLGKDLFKSSSNRLRLDRSASERIFGVQRSTLTGEMTIKNLGQKIPFGLRVDGDDAYASQLVVANSGQPKERSENDATYRSTYVEFPEDKEIPACRAQVVKGQVYLGDGNETAANAKVWVYAEQEDAPSAVGLYAYTDDAGNFQVSPWAGARFRIEVVPPKGLPYGGLRMERTATEIKQASPLILRLPAARTVSGVVVDSQSNASLEGVEIFFESFDDDETVPSGWMHTTKTGKDGRFSLAIPESKGTLLVRSPSRTYVLQERVLQMAAPVSKDKMVWGQRTYAHAFLDVNSGTESLSDQTIALQLGISVTTQVVDEANQPVTEAFVWNSTYIHFLSPFWRGYGEHADRVRDGAFTLEGLSPGKDYNVVILDPVRRIGATAKLNTDQPLGTLKLLPCGQARMKVVDSEGNPISGISPAVCLVLNNGFSSGMYPDRMDLTEPADQALLGSLDQHNHPRSQVTDRNGGILFSGLVPEATYRYFRRESGKTYPVDFQVSPREVVEITSTMER